ncbi:MAG: hypothetical protein IPH03_17020 [Tetrasphaera sp.]|nr:hypothetical protein [Tetrasphaera sp.]
MDPDADRSRPTSGAGSERSSGRLVSIPGRNSPPTTGARPPDPGPGCRRTARSGDLFDNAAADTLLADRAGAAPFLHRGQDGRTCHGGRLHRPRRRGRGNIGELQLGDAKLLNLFVKAGRPRAQGLLDLFSDPGVSPPISPPTLGITSGSAPILDPAAEHRVPADHCDVRDVFVVQVAGTKTVANSARRSPSSAAPTVGETVGTPSAGGLKATRPPLLGDSRAGRHLYLSPRGLVHAATACIAGCPRT